MNYVKKFEGQKPGREKRLENDPTIFRYRISFLMLIYTFYEILVFIIFLIMSFFNVKIIEKVWFSIRFFQNESFSQKKTPAGSRTAKRKRFSKHKQGPYENGVCKRGLKKMVKNV